MQNIVALALKIMIVKPALSAVPFFNCNLTDVDNCPRWKRICYCFNEAVETSNCFSLRLKESAKFVNKTL